MRECDEAIWRLFLLHMKAEKRSKATEDAYWYALADLSASLPAGTDLLGAGQEEITAWLAGLNDRVSASTAGTYQRRAKTFYKHMSETGIYEAEHPMRGIDMITADDNIMRCPREDEILQLLKACEGKDWRARRDYAMVRVLLEAGTPRASELARLRMDAVDQRNGEVQIHGKGRNERAISLGAKSSRALLLWLRARQGRALASRPLTRDLVFFTAWGPMDKDSARKIIGARCAEAGITPALTPHDFRRFTYDKWEGSGGSETAAMKLWGWRTRAMPELYGRQNEGRRAIGHAREMSLGDQI